MRMGAGQGAVQLVLHGIVSAVHGARHPAHAGVHHGGHPPICPAGQVTPLLLLELAIFLRISCWSRSGGCFRFAASYKCALKWSFGQRVRNKKKLVSLEGSRNKKILLVEFCCFGAKVRFFLFRETEDKRFDKSSFELCFGEKLKINTKTKDISSGIVVQRGNTSTDCFRPSDRSCGGILRHVEIAFLLPIAGRA